MRAAIVIAIASITTTAAVSAPATAEPTALAPQAHADLGLSVVGVGYERPVAGHVAVRGEVDGQTGQGLGFTAGAFAGWAIGLGERLDLRLGAGAQWIYFDADPLAASTPFLAADILLGYRL